MATYSLFFNLLIYLFSNEMQLIHFLKKTYIYTYTFLFLFFDISLKRKVFKVETTLRKCQWRLASADKVRILRLTHLDSSLAASKSPLVGIHTSWLKGFNLSVLPGDQRNLANSYFYLSKNQKKKKTKQKENFTKVAQQSTFCFCERLI